jgi:hypothetical protein
MAARLDRSGVSPAARRFIAERTRQNAKTSQTTTIAPMVTAARICTNVVAAIPVDISR